MIKRLLWLFALCFLLFEIFSPTPAQAQPSSAADDPDKNIKVRGWESVTGQLNLIPFVHDTDPGAPQLSTLIEGVALPSITSLYQVYEGGSLYPRPDDLPSYFDFATLVGFDTGGKNILVPESGYTLGGGFEVFVLYADSDSITLQYTCDDSVARGYTIHLVGFNVDGGLLALYNRLDLGGREELPILKAGARIGRGSGDILVATRDTGSFLDPRWEYDWWQRETAAPGRPLELTSQSVDACTGEQHGCEDPRNGPKDKGCYGATVTKGSPDDSIWDTLLRVIKEVVFKWGGSEQKIEVQKLTIPIEYDLRKLLGIFPGGTPAVINEETLTHFQSGVLPKLTPPGPPLESLHQNITSYLDDYSKGVLDAESCKAPGSEEKDVEVNAPDVWGLANTAIRLAFSLVELPGSTPPAYVFNNEGATLASQRIPKEDVICKSSAGTTTTTSNTPVKRSAVRINNSAATTPTPTIKLAQSNGECPYGPGTCPQKTEAADKNLCIRGEGELDEEDEERMCSVGWQTFDCTPNTVFACPNGLELSCNPNGTVDCPSSSCPGSSENKISLFPEISFLPDYTNYIIKTYKLFLTPGTLPKPLDGEGKIEWSYAGVPQGDGSDDDNPAYPKLGTVECLEDYVKRALSPPGHGLTPKEGCFD